MQCCIAASPALLNGCCGCCAPQTQSVVDNAQRLNAYKTKLVVLPRRNSKNPKAGDASAEEVKFATQLKGDLFPIVNKPTPVTFEKVPEAKNVYAILRQERCNARMAGKRAKKAKEAAEAADNKKPGAGDD